MAHILIVEDEKSINDLIAMNLELVGHTSQQAYESHEALEYLTQTRPRMDSYSGRKF